MVPRSVGVVSTMDPHAITELPVLLLFDAVHHVDGSLDPLDSLVSQRDHMVRLVASHLGIHGQAFADEGNPTLELAGQPRCQPPRGACEPAISRIWPRTRTTTRAASHN